MSEEKQEKSSKKGRSRDPRGNRRPSRGKGDKSYNAWTRGANLAALADRAPWRPQGRRWLTGSTQMSTAAYHGGYAAGQGLHALFLGILPAPGFIARGIVLDSLRQSSK